MARALALQARGQGFDSLILHEPEGRQFIDIMEEEDTRDIQLGDRLDASNKKKESASKKT